MPANQREHARRTLHVGAPNTGNRQYFDQLVDEIFERRWFTNDGVLVKQLETKIKRYLGVKHCLLVPSATVGLQLASHALELSGEVIVPAFTFVATPHSVHWEGLKPVFADIDPVTHTLCPKSVESRITDRTSAILGVHLWGTPCDTEQLDQLASKHGLQVFYDAAHAFGCRSGEKMIGNFGRCEVFSFHATKFFNTFEGGAIVTNCDELAERLALMRNFGFAGMDEVVYLGTNAKMPEICAAMGLSLFSELPGLLQRNELNYQLYRAHLQGLPGIRLLSFDFAGQTNHQYVVLEI
ncbi:MAG: DegT/DnrJ/EryC1/StrS family aminotransferase, partial [Planctomycetota bacterium]